MSTKTKISVTVDSDIIDFLHGDDAKLSAQVNDALRLEVERRKRQLALRTFLDDMWADEGAAPNESKVKRHIKALTTE